jgi:DNA repair exonuclease SbcCD ATPase subunit
MENLGSEENILAAIEQEEGAITPEAPAPATGDLPITEDPEIDLGGEKVKRSQVLEWKKANLLQSDYTKKTQELAQQRKELDQLVKFADYLKANPAKLQKVLAALEDKAEAAQVKQEAITTELEGLDPNDPYAKALKQQLAAITAQLKPLQEKLTQLEQRDMQSEQSQLVEKAQQVLKGTLEEVTKTLTFDNDEEKATWRSMVLSYLKDNPKDYTNENDFKTTIGEVGKKYYDALQKIGEAKVKKYLESKKGPVTPPASGVQGSVLKAKPTFTNIEDLLQSELEKAATQGE